MRPGTIFFIGVPVIANALVCAGGFFWRPEIYLDRPWICWLSLALTLAAALVAMLGLLLRDKPYQSMIAIGIQVALLILNFAGIYRGFGLKVQPGTEMGWDVALYFSIVTWTTLGYGDVTVPQQLYLIAATEAVLGYVFFGLFVGIGAAILSTSP
jgi:hypothetical protein